MRERRWARDKEEFDRFMRERNERKPTDIDPHSS